MARMESSDRTLVCSVLFLDIVGYSKKPVADQLQLKQSFNRALSEALEAVPPRDRVITDTGDGAAVTFFGDPENALFVALSIRENAGRPAVRMGINLGPVRMVHDLNGEKNVIGDGINNAQRVMNFSKPGQVLVSRSFYEVVSCLATEYAGLFRHEGPRTDKHVRVHDVYAVVAGARARRRAGEAAPAVDETRAHLPAEVFDAGAHLIVSGYSKSSVQDALNNLAQSGSRVISDITEVGAKWVAACEHPQVPLSACRIEELGYTRIVTGPTQEAVVAKLEELVQFGAVVVRAAELVGGVWAAVCEVRPSGR